MLYIILSLLHAEETLNQLPDPLVDPRFYQEPGLTKTLNSTVSYTFDFSGPSITDFKKFSPSDETALLDSPISTEHKFMIRLPLYNGFQLSIKPMFRTYFHNLKNDGSSVDIFESMNLGFDISKELFDMGFKNIYLATGLAKHDFNQMPWIKDVVSKNFPLIT